MGYPRNIQTLIIEDEPEMIEAYRRYFENFIRAGHDVAMPIFAGGYKNATFQLGIPRPYHLVILDLKLPEYAGGDAEGGSSRGLELIEKIAAREDYPVPVLLIITGEPKRIGNLTSMSDQLHENFFHAQVITKGLKLEEEIFQHGILKAWQYNDFGIRLVDRQEEPRPPLTPREEDLIRRGGLSNETNKGVDLVWWSAERKDRGAGWESPQWVKVLQGRCVLDGDDGMSRHRFFKLESVENGERAHKSALRMQNKLPHIRVLGFHKSGTRSLLVTEKAGLSDEPPISLNTFLRMDTDVVLPSVPRLVHEIAEQLRRCDQPQKEPRLLPKLLWEHHTPESLDAAWGKFCGDVAGDDISPASLWSMIRSSEERVWVDVRACQHGDLHLGNVSLDFNDGVAPQAFIFDAGSMSRTVCGRDLARLEVSLLLHQKYQGGASLVSACAPLYDGSAADGERDAPDELPPHHRNTHEMVKALRREALTELEGHIYCLLLLDETLIQLGSLSFGTSQNKIVRAYDAVELYRLLSVWVRREHSSTVAGGVGTARASCS
jgi:CheY-like chemotaxis protein